MAASGNWACGHQPVKGLSELVAVAVEFLGVRDLLDGAARM